MFVDLFGEEPPAPPAPRKWTEREILDLLRERYTREVLGAVVESLGGAA